MGDYLNLHIVALESDFESFSISAARYLPHRPIDPQDDIDEGQSELPRDDAEEKAFGGVDDSDLLNYLARDPKVAEEIIDKAKRINLR